MPESLFTPEVAQYEGSITASDRELLTSLGIIWPEDSEEKDWLSSFNDLIDLGSLPPLKIVPWPMKQGRRAQE